MLTHVFVCLLVVASALPAASWDVVLLPTTPLIAPAGSAFGWGYSITNNSGADWLVFTSFYATPVPFAYPAPVFDFPIVAPGQTVATPWIPGVIGILEWTWDPLASPGMTDTGLLRLEADWYTAPPLSGGVLVGTADPAAMPFTVSVGVPEPATLPAGSLALALAILLMKRR